jgi:hypothetical protein
VNSGPYVDHDHDAQEYRPGPMAPKCSVCDLPTALCDCTALDRIRAHADWLVAAAAVVGLAVAAIFGEVA